MKEAPAAEVHLDPSLPQTFTGDEDFDRMLRQCRDILGFKGRDYTVGTDDRLHNFYTVAKFLDVHPYDVLGVYLYKHTAAVFNFLKSKGQSESEPIEGRISDVINYMLLFYKMVQRERDKAQAQ